MALNLPESRNTTHVAGTSQIKAEDMNDIQDQIVSIATGWRKIPLDGVGDVVNFGTEGITFPAGAATRQMDFPVDENHRILTVRINYSRDAGDTLSVEVRRKLQGAASARIAPAAGALALGAGTEVEAEIDVTADVVGGLLVKQRERYVLHFVKTGASALTGLEMLEFEYDTKRA